jgi:hypothetical protein
MPPAMAAANGNLSVDRKWAMGFLSSKNAGENDRAVRDTGSESPSARQDDFYADLITRRPDCSMRNSSCTNASSMNSI